VTSPMIEALGLRKRFGPQEVLRGVDLKVDAGEIFALLGPNGAGKTTTVRILATLARADGGSARVAGADVLTERHAVRRTIALTGQSTALDQLQTGRENLRMISRLAGLSTKQASARTDQLLDRFDLQNAAGRRVATYSGGMRRRLDLAASLVGRPSVIFLDEPTTGLDPRSRQDVWAIVAELAREGTTIFLTTQYLEEADRLADHIAVIDGGVVVAEGTAAALKAQVGGFRLELVASTPAAYDVLRGRLSSAIVSEDPAACTIAVSVEDAAAEIRALLDQVDPGGDLITRFAIHSASLDDAFLALTGRVAAATKETDDV
jgi:ABC-2 type transport system ATP-binding protein